MFCLLKARNDNHQCGVIVLTVPFVLRETFIDIPTNKFVLLWRELLAGTGSAHTSADGK